MSIYLLSRILIKPGDIVVVASLSSSTINMTFLNAQAQVITIPIDKNGIQTDALRHILITTKIRAIYITPHLHYPTTVTLSAKRRIDLLQLANQHKFIIIEDDYDYDFHYDKTAVLPILSADTQGMVIYTGTFGRSLAPSFQTSFIIAPQNLIIELQKYQGIIDRHGDNIMEQALGEMIEEGNMYRHIKKSIRTYKERRDLVCAELDFHFQSNEIIYQKPSGGLAIWVEFNTKISLAKLSEKAKEFNLTIPRDILYQNKNITAMRLGFGHMNNEDIKSSIAILKKCYTLIALDK